MINTIATAKDLCTKLNAYEAETALMNRQLREMNTASLEYQQLEYKISQRCCIQDVVIAHPDYDETWQIEENEWVSLPDGQCVGWGESFWSDDHWQVWD